MSYKEVVRSFQFAWGALSDPGRSLGPSELLLCSAGMVKFPCLPPEPW